MLPRVRSVEEVWAYWQPQWEARRRERLAECEANGAHVLEMDAHACPHCDTPYADPDPERKP